MKQRLLARFLIGLYVLSAAGCDTSDRAANRQHAQAVAVSCKLLIQDVNIVDVLDGAIREHQDVCVRGDRIVRVTDHSAFHPAESDVAVGAAGKFLIPGLHDMHVHFRGGEEALDENRDLLTLYLAHGITGVYDLGGDITEDLLEWREAIRARERIGPDLYLVGPKIDGPNPQFAGSLVVATQQDAESAADRLLALGVDGAKIMGGTLSVEKGFARDKGYAEEHQREFQTLKSHLDWTLTEVEKTDILVLVGSDSGPGNSIPGRVTHREMALLVAAGLSPAYVLRAATYNPAVFLGRADKAGTIEEGRAANMVVLAANPLTDIANVRTIDGVIKSGQYYPKSDIDAMLSALATKYAE